MISRNCLTRSDSAISQKSLKFLLEFYCFILVILFMIFSILLFLVYFILKIFSLISMPSHNFWFYVLQACSRQGSFFYCLEVSRLRIFATCGISQVTKFPTLRIFVALFISPVLFFIFRLRPFRFQHPPLIFTNYF